MISITGKVKLAGAIAAGALSLGVVGAAAAGSGSTTTLASTPTSVTFTSPSGQTLTVDNLSTTAPTSTALTFTNQGQCVSHFATSKDFALAASVAGSKLSKNFHGKLMSSSDLKQFCASFKASKSTTAQTPDATESPEVEQPDAAESPDAGSNGKGQAGLHGRGHKGGGSED
jgi:hypothetical protein